MATNSKKILILAGDGIGPEVMREAIKVLRAAAKKYIDPDKRPAVAKQHGVQQYGTIVLNYKGRTERVTSDTEQDITNAIIKVVEGKAKPLYIYTDRRGDVAGA